MIELCDDVATDKLDKHAIVYKHLIALNEQFYYEIFGHIDAVKRVLIFNDAFSELIEMAQGKYLDDYYERIRNNAV